jgi:hypothetical protein
LAEPRNCPSAGTKSLDERPDHPQVLITAQHTFSLSAYAGQTITLTFTGSEDHEYQTSFVIDDTAINVS